MTDSKETKLLNLISVILVALAGVIRFAVKRIDLFGCNTLVFSLLAASIIIWIFQLHKRLIQPQIRKNLIAAAFLMLLWMIIRTMKYVFIPLNSTGARYAWYLYYLPMLFIPLLMFLSVLSIGCPGNKPICRKWYLLFIPALLILTGILTNDLHQKAFLFQGGLAFWNEAGISYGFVYFVSQIWIALMFVGMLSVVFIRCVILKNRRNIYIPMIPLLFGAAYTVGVIAGYEDGLTVVLTVPEVCCFVYAAFIESLICIRLIPCNDNYKELWSMSSIGAGIMNNEGKVVYKSQKSMPVTAEQVFRAEKETVLLDGGNVSLCSHVIHGGYGYWTKNISELNRMNKELEDLGNVLTEENAMLDAENKLREQLVFIQQQNNLYDDMNQSMTKQLNKLDDILAAPLENEADFEREMKYACIPMVYIKRRSNLFLLANKEQKVAADELQIAISESLEYVSLCGIKAYCSRGAAGVYPGEKLLAAYDVFEEAIEYAVPDTDAVFVILEANGRDLSLHININAPRNYISESMVQKYLCDTGGTIEIEQDEQSEIITLRFPGGGDSV